jgi:hypothetical protein
MKQSLHYSFVREKDAACADSYFHTLLRPDSYFGDAIQDAKQLFLSRLLQMTKYFVIRECENIPTWISLCLTTVFSQQGGIYVFKFPKRFSEFSWAKISLYWLFFTLLSLCWLYNDLSFLSNTVTNILWILHDDYLRSSASDSYSQVCHAISHVTNNCWELEKTSLSRPSTWRSKLDEKFEEMNEETGVAI